MSSLPRVGVAGHDEVMDFLESRNLQGTGLGWIDAHLLASALISHVRLWTLDRTLGRAARTLAISAQA